MLIPCDLSFVLTLSVQPPKPPPLTPPQSAALVTSLMTTMHALSSLRDFMSELDDIHSILRVPQAQCPAATRIAALHRFNNELLPQSWDRVTATASILLEQADIFHGILDSISPEPLNPKADGTMTGGLGPAHKKVSTMFSGIRLEQHPLFNFRPFARFCCVCTRARFHVVKGLSRFPVLDGFTFWSLGRLEHRLEKLMVVDEVGDLYAMKYAVIGVAQEIIGRRGKEIGIADTEERCSVDSDEGIDSTDWVGRVLGPRGRRISGWGEEEGKGKGKGKERCDSV